MSDASRTTRIALATAALLTIAAGDPAASSILETSIQVDGRMSDWEAVLRNARNGVVDRASYDGDPDAPTETQFDLRRLAVTWDDEHLFLLWQHTAKLGPTNRRMLVLLAYLDLDHDDAMTAADAVLALRFSSNFLGDRGLFAYVPAGVADPLPGDGQAVAGRGGAALPATIDAVAELAHQLRFEVAVRWADLGLSPGSPVRIQAAIANIDGLALTASEAVALLPLGVEDNAGVFDSGEVAVSLSPGASFGAEPGGIVDLPHLLTTADGNLAQTIELRASVDDGFALELWTDPDGDGDPSDGRRLARDEDGNGVYFDAGDVLDPGGDTTANLLPDTGPLGAGASFAFVVRAFPPSGNPQNGVRTVSIVATSDRDPAIAATASDELRVSRVTVASSHDRHSIPGAAVPFPHRVCMAHNQPHLVQLTATSALGWPVTILEQGVAVTSLALDPSTCAEVELIVDIPAGASVGSVDDLTLTASMTNPESDDTASDRLTVSAPITLAPDRSGFGLAGASVFYAHTVRNATPTSASLDLAAAVPVQTGVTFWTDPNGDGLPGDGETVTLTPALAPFGGSLDLLLQLDLRANLVTGDIVSADLSATQAAPPLMAPATDLTTIRLIATYPSPPPTNPSSIFPGCSTVHVDAGPVLSFRHRFLWYDANDLLVRASPDLFADAAGLVADSLTFLSTDPGGTWRIELEVDDGSGWAQVVPGGLHELELRRQLQPDGGLLAALASDRLTYPVSGETMAITAELADISPLTYHRSTVRYLLYRDADGDGQPSTGDPAIDLFGQSAPWTAASFTCRATGLASILPGDRYVDTSCSLIGPIDFVDTGEWRLQARWLTECGDVIAERTESINVGCSGTIAADAGLDRAVCAGDSVQIGGLPADPTASYRWSPADGLDDPSAAQPIATPLGTTLYALTVSDPASCVQRDEVRVTVQLLPAVDTGPSQRICAGDSVTIGSPPEPGRDYLWTPATGLDDPTLAEPQASPASATTYLLTVTDQVTSCAAQAQVVVDVDPIPSADAGPDRGIGARIGPATCDPSLVYQWTPATDLDDPLACNPIATPASPWIYCLTTRAVGSGCASAPDCVEVGDVACPATPDAGVDQPSAPAVLGPAACDPAVEYQWTPSADLDDPTACNPTATPSTTTTYCLTARDPGSGCVSAADCVEVAVGCATPPDAVSRLDAVRAGDAVTISWSATAGADGGYHVYRVDTKADLAAGAPGSVVIDAVPGELSGLDPTAAAATHYYRVTAVCSDGTTEGP